MTSVEKRRSGRKSGGHRKHSDGGYSDTSSGGSFLDETDREVSNLTDRAFRSLCIGDEAVYNDSDLCSSSPCTQRDRQLAFSQSGQDRDREDRERDELKRAAHESFSIRMQQYGQDWIHGGMYGAEIQRDPQWEVYGERTQGRVSATFQHSFVETSQQEESLGGEQLSFLGNGPTELSLRQRRSRSRVSSLIRAFNSEGQRDGAGKDGQLREWNDETSWDKSALMSIQRELSEFSTSYQQNFNSGHFSSACPFSYQDTNFYSSEVAAVAHMNSASSFMRSSHSKHSMSTQVNCNTNFFIHSEFSPFKVWRDHNRFPFQQGEVSGFMHCSEFPKWYDTPMYRELSMEAQPQGPYRFEERGIRHQRNNLAPVVPSTLPRSTSTSTMLQKASAVEKRCESEVTGHYPHRKRTQSLGTNRLPSQRPSTASPTSEMSRRVQDTISSVKALQQKIKMMTEKNTTTGMTANHQGVFCTNDNLIPFGNNAKTVAPNVVSSNTSTTPFNISQLLTPLVQAHQETETSEVGQYAVSPQPVEHPPVRAESRGATPDVRMCSYKSRATSLLFNLKDNRKRVKSTYSPAKFKALETLEKSKHHSIQEPRDTVIDIPDYPDLDFQFLQVEESSRANAASHQYVNQYHSPGLSLTTPNSQPAHTGQHSEYTLSDYQTAQMQSQIVHHSGFTGLIPENYTSNQLANGQHLHEDLSSFTPYKQGMIDKVETLGGDVYRLNTTYTDTETPRIHADNNQPREYLISKANAEQHFNETVGGEFTKVDRYQQLKENKHDYSNVSSQDRWRQTNSQDTESLSLKAVSPWKQEITASMEKDQHAQAYQRAAVIKEELNSPRDKYRGENQQSINKELEKIELRESFGIGTSSHKKAALVNTNISNQQQQNAPFSNDTIENPAYYGQQQPGALKYNNKENEMKDHYLTQNYNRYSDQEYRNQHTLYSNKDKRMPTQETVQKKQSSIPQPYEMQSLQPIEAKPQFEQNVQKTSLSNPDNASATTIANQVKDRQFVEVKAEQVMAQHVKAQHTQAELAKAQHWAQVEQPKAESARLILAGQTGSDKVKAEEAKAELTEYQRVNQAKAEHIKEDKRKEELTEQSREKQPERAREEQIKAAQSRVQVTEEPRNITEEVGAEDLREEKGEQVKVKQAEAKRLKEEHIKTELAKAEQARQDCSERAKSEQASRERIKAEQINEEQVRADQVEREQVDAEQIRTEKVKSEQAKAEHKKAEQAKLEHIQEQQAKAEQEKTNVVEVGKVKANHIQVEDVNQEKAEEDSIQAGRVNAEQPVTQISKANERKAELAKLEQTKVELAKAELIKTENVPERSAKPAAKLTVTQQVKNEPDKLEQVKTELAKAKAELAKIKEKMRGEQKEKVRNRVLTNEDVIKTDVPLKVNINKKEEYKDQDQATQMHKQGEDSVVVSRQNSDQANRGDEYERLREKYGFIDTHLPNRNKVSNDANETPALSLDKVETTNNEKSKGNSSPKSRVASANTENKEEVGSFKPTELTESQYVYSESSKEFKLSESNYLPINVDKREKSDTVSDKVKDESVEKFDSLKHTDISQQRDSDLAKPLPLARKPRSTEHSLGPGKDTLFTPPRALFHKERAQTKQEILTSKIKAHAEKEISAIKEKGFAVRDGFISKNSTKQLAVNNIRQRPPSQEVSKKHESTMASNITLKHQMEPSGIQMEPVKFVSLPSSSTIPVKSAATTSQVQSQKQLHNKPMKSNDNLPKKPREAKQTGSYTMSTDDGLVQNQKKENQFGMKSLTQSKEQALKNKPETQEANKGEIFGKQKEGLKDNPVLNTDHLNKKELKQGAESKHEAVHEDSAPSLSLAFGQNETPVAEDKLQIMGISVTVRERKPSVDNGQRNNSTQEQMNVKEKECSNSELDKCNPSSGLEVGKGNTSSKEVSMVKLNDGVVQDTDPTVKEDQTKVGMDNHPENMLETSRQNNVSENVTVKRTNLQQESSSINVRPQRITQLQEPLAEKGVPCKNKVLAETNPLLYNQDIIANETKDNTNEMPKENPVKIIEKVEVKSNTEDKNPQKSHTAHANENYIAKVVNTAISDTNDANRAAAQTLIKHDIQPSVKEDMTTGIHPSKSRNIDGKSAPVEEKRCDLTPPKPFNKTIPSNHLTENENAHASLKHQYKETHVEENNQWDDDLHIGSIAIRVVPAVTEDNLKMAGKHHVNITTVPSDVAAANEHKQDASSSLENNEDRTKDLNTESREKQMEESLEDKFGIQCVLSSVKKLSKSLQLGNQQNSINTTSENTQAENAKPEKVNKSGKSADELTVRPMVGDYFQVQGTAEKNNEPYNHTNAVSKGRELPALLSNKAAISNESCNEGKNPVFVLDQSKRKSSSVRVQDENMKKRNRETDDNLDSKLSDGPTERQSNKNEKTEAGQAVHIRKLYTENQSSLTARETKSSINSYLTQEDTVKEKPKVKPKPKERVSTIPEISAIADYARLKVIVSEDEANKIQEFPPNKKEGFFPLIQTRHSRRPMFTADPQDLSVKEKSLPNKTEVSSKVNKQPKPLVFPITEREHQRTGMFKLGDKERQEKMILDAKANEGVLDTGAKHAQQLKASNKSPSSHLKNQGREEQVTGTDTQRVRQVEQSIHQPNNPPMQATTSSSAVNRPRSTSVSQHLKPLEISNPHEKLVGQVYNIEESTTTLKKDEEIENALAKIGEKRTDKMRQERFATRHEETETQHQSRAKQFEEKQASRIEEEKRAEDMRVRNMIEENRASVAEEERRAAQREEERRARERETIAIKIKEKREKQREAERRAEEERAAQKEEEMKANQREEERRMKEIEEKRRIEIEECKAKLREEEEQIKENEEKRRVKQQEEERAAREEMQRRAAEEGKQRRAAEEERQRRAAEEEKQRRAAKEEKQKRAAEEDKQRRAAEEEKQKRAAEEEKQKRAAEEDKQRRAAEEEKQRRAAEEEKQRRAALIEEQRRAKVIEEQILADIEEKAARISEEERIKQIQEQKKAEQMIEELREERQQKEEWMRTQRAVEKDKTIIKQREERQAKEERTRLLEESQAALKEEEKRVAREWMLAQREDEIRAKKRGEEKLAAHREKERATQMEEQKRAAQRMDALQYYAITSTESERKPRERQLCSPLPSQQRPNPSGLGSPEDSGAQTRPYRPHAPASPAPSLPRSNTSSPALGAKPSMFRVKDNTIRGSSFKSVKPRLHKNFGEDFRMGSPMERGSERREEEQDIVRHSAGTPVYPDTGLNRLAAIKESNTFQPAYSSQDYSALLPQHRPYSRRSIALDEDDSRSLISNMSEDVESFATSAADLADIRGLYDGERPESACSFSSDVSRSLGKPPTVPPKSEKALRRAKRLTTRRIKKELSKAAADSPDGVEKSLQEVSNITSSSSTEVRSSSRQAMASSHFSLPVSLAHAPTLGSSLLSSHTEHKSSRSSSYASPHATGPISIPVALPHATAPVSLPVASPNATGPASHTAAPKTVAHVSSSPTLHHANHPAPVTQYHVESSYPQSYPLTQRKVLQDLGSGQYFVVDVPVQVKKKTFFDPETGRYVQLNVRESGQSTSRTQPQQTYPQPQLQPQKQVKLQQQPQASPAGKPFVLYQGNQSYPQDYQPLAINSVPRNMSSAPVTLHQDQQPVRESHSYGYPAPEMGQNSEGHRYSPEKTPYMDTVNDKGKTYNTIYSTHAPYESSPEGETNSQLAGSSVCENDNSAHSQCQPRDIITMSELEDFMEVSDW
ncbi:uncharacterized protein LOC120548483 [Perca fluviatilis]|uniref:uncharacterized protein LOC120548483 n=1 Tax=Perca fluviatilis TaxID=8168 RepID=UPI00196659BE|nr:uncharacterized protein LOC120548483 [Perca fluviatilis]